ncbi:MAG: hypothetical protein WC830_01810 [Burkholderiales bacterium]
MLPLDEARHIKQGREIRAAAYRKLRLTPSTHSGCPTIGIMKVGSRSQAAIRYPTLEEATLRRIRQRELQGISQCREIKIDGVHFNADIIGTNTPICTC